MNMKRGLVLSLSALALVVMGTSFAHAQANIQLSLNLRYTDPADPSEGGTWFLVAKTDDPEGIAAISAYISNIVPGAAMSSYGNGTGAGSGSYAATSAATIGAILNGSQPFVATIGGAVNIVYGQDLANGPIVLDVGQGAGTPGNTAVDPLRNAAWDNAAIIANGTFAGGGAAGNGFNRPAFVVAGTNSTDGNTLQGNTLNVPGIDANVTTAVRGDSVFTFGLNSNPAAGLRPGDINRDGTVNIGDFAVLQNNFNQSPRVWDTGDVNDDNTTNIGDFAVIQNNFNQSAPAPISAVPEPASLTLVGLSAICGMMLARRRSNS
jgi:hypothetical protein